MDIPLNFKHRVRAFWNAQPCGTGDNPHPPHTAAYYQWIERERDDREPFIARFARWADWRGKKVLEMGTGAGTDFVRFGRAGATAFGIDLTENGLALVRERLDSERLASRIAQADVETLPFPEDTFDFVYSWGVIHHTENTPAAAREVVRVLKPSGRFCVMVYHRYSLHCLRGYLRFGLLNGRPLSSLDKIVSEHFESFGTKVYTTAEARSLFAGIDLTVTHVLTPYDLQLTRRRFVPPSLRRALPEFLGYFMVLEGRKPERRRA
jgi:ubiquinone/menaquinone biosynthesis C-methylase UbiE